MFIDREEIMTRIRVYELISPEARKVEGSHCKDGKLYLFFLQLKNSFSFVIATSKCHTGKDIRTQNVEFFMYIDLKLSAGFSLDFPLIQHG